MKCSIYGVQFTKSYVLVFVLLLHVTVHSCIVNCNNYTEWQVQSTPVTFPRHHLGMGQMTCPSFMIIIERLTYLCMIHKRQLMFQVSEDCVLKLANTQSERVSLPKKRKAKYS